MYRFILGVGWWAVRGNVAVSVGLNVSVEVEAGTGQGFQQGLMQILPKRPNLADTVNIDLK
jgi:hypothetical protein